MRKETGLAILAGVIIGLIFAFGSWRVSRSIKKNVNTNIQAKQTPPTSKNLSLTILSHKNFDIATQNPVTISGTATPGSNILISTAENDYQIKVDEEGQFQESVELTPDLSKTKIVSIGSDNKVSTIELFLVYSSEFEKYLENLNGKKPTSYVGTVTDISGGTIQIKAEDGGILLASTKEDTTYINTLKKNQEVKLTDLAIGDYVAILGLKNGNTVLDGKRVLIISSSIDEIEVIAGKVLSAAKKELVIQKPDGNEESFTMPKKWNGPNLDELTEGQNIIITGTEDDDEKLTIRSLLSL